MAPRTPRNLNPEGSGKGAMPGLGRPGQNTTAIANQRAGAGQSAAELFSKQMKANQVTNPFRGSAISDYWKVLKKGR